MKIEFTKNKLRNIVFLLLAVFVFSFLHSELGVWDYDGNNHEAHDFCEIVKYTAAQPIVSQELNPVKPQAEYDTSIIVFEKIIAQDAQLLIDRIIDSEVFINGSKIYLHHEALLI